MIDIKSKDKKLTKKKVAIIAGSILFILVLFFTVTLVMGSVAIKGDTIYPNVKVNGVSIGGITEEQAVEELKAANDNTADKSITVNFPDGQTLEVKTLEVGLTPNSEQAAELAYEYGRDSNILLNSLKYIKCVIGLGVVDINEEINLTLDDVSLKSITESAAQTLSTEPVDYSYEVSEDKLLVTMGKEGMQVDADSLYTALSEAFLASKFDDIEYEATLIDPAELDIQTLYDEVYTDPENSVYDKSTGSVTQGTKGISFDTDSAFYTIAGAGSGETVEIELVLTDPEITAEDLEGLLFSTLLASKTTTLTNNSNRNNNIELAANAINGYVLNPGEQFSFNDVVGERTTAKGYLAAGAYANGTTVTEVGGGICQVSSTIYYSALMSDLNIITRYAHTFTVSYLPLGMDATVSWGGPEFVFSNSTDYPIKIYAKRDGLNLTVEIYGTKTNDYTITLDSVVTNTINYSTKYEDDSSLAAGATSVKTAGRTGYTVNTYRYVYDGDGNLIREETVNTSSYSKLDEVILRGAG